MFYDLTLPAPPAGAETAAALVVLDPAESRRLLARAVRNCADHAYDPASQLQALLRR